MTTIYIAVFKTNINSLPDANLMTAMIKACYRSYEPSFNLSDRNRILRIENPEFKIEVFGILNLMIENGFYCMPLISHLK